LRLQGKAAKRSERRAGQDGGCEPTPAPQEVKSGEQAKQKIRASSIERLHAKFHRACIREAGKKESIKKYESLFAKRKFYAQFYERGEERRQSSDLK
jgi:hypothetical protein